jgi:ubiquinone/menaquinone biosynthesis C-methylase UbiE
VTELTPDELQTAFHDVECATYDERFGIAYDHRGTRAAAREVARLTGSSDLGRVLDVGCGTGYLGIALAAENGARTVHATDISPGMLARTVENAESIGVDVRPVRATATALPYRDDAFDAVVSRGVLHHLHDPVTALVEWRRVTRPGGHVVVLSEPSPHADSVGARIALLTQAGLGVARRIAERLQRPLSAHPEEEADIHRYWDLVAMAANLHTFTPEDLATLGEKGGFDHVAVRGAGLASISWATAYYVLVGELPGVAGSDRAKRRASRVWSALRRLDETAIEPIVPDRALLTVQAVFVA